MANEGVSFHLTLKQIGEYLIRAGQFWDSAEQAAGKAGKLNKDGLVPAIAIPEYLALELESELGIEAAKQFAVIARYFSEKIYGQNTNGFSMAELWAHTIDIMDIIVAARAGRVQTLESSHTGLVYKNDGSSETIGFSDMQLSNAEEGPVVRKTHKDL